VHVYGSRGAEVTALRGVDLTIEPGETVALLGPSGDGKTTLLWHLAGLLRPTAGVVEVNDHRLTKLSARELLSFRLREIGVVLQNPVRNLLTYDSALGNVLFAQEPTRRTHRTKRRRAGALLEAVGLTHVAEQPAGQLSGGEQQRLALAVALANGPRLLLVDEPTSQLDADSADAVLQLLRAANEELGTTIVAVSHDPEVAAGLSRTVTIRDGRVGGEGREGREYVVVSPHGTITLPPELLDELPPGSLAEAEPVDRGIVLRRVDRDDDERLP
jgi:ABC-type lipoprotein export system ATPase subunit